MSVVAEVPVNEKVKNVRGLLERQNLSDAKPEVSAIPNEVLFGIDEPEIKQDLIDLGRFGDIEIELLFDVACTIASGILPPRNVRSEQSQVQGREALLTVQHGGHSTRRQKAGLGVSRCRHLVKVANELVELVRRLVLLINAP